MIMNEGPAFPLQRKDNLPAKTEVTIDADRSINRHQKVTVFDMRIAKEHFMRFGGPTTIEATVTVHDHPPTLFRHSVREVDLLSEQLIIVNTVELPVS